MRQTMLFAILVCLFGLEPAYSQRYTITDLGTLGGGPTASSAASGINDRGEVTGVSDTLGASHAFLYRDGKMIDLGVIGGLWSEGFGINNRAQVTGWTQTCEYPCGYYTRRAFFYSAGVMEDIGTLGGSFSTGFGINDSGQITGDATIPGDGASHAFRYSKGTMTDLGTLGGPDSVGYAINASGQVTGDSIKVLGQQMHAFLYSGGTMMDLGTLGGPHSTGYGINDAGQVVGSSYVSGTLDIHAFLYSGGKMTDLGTLGGRFSEARGINIAGQVVGYSYTENDVHAFLYTPRIGMVDLNGLIPNGSGWSLFQARGINNRGQITGAGTNPQGLTHAFLLTPVVPYKAYVQPPITPDGSSIFKVNRGRLPVKFTLTQDNIPTCSLPAARFMLTRTAGGPVEVVQQGDFRIDSCQYIYNLGVKGLKMGVYRADITIDGQVVGAAQFGLR